MESSILSRYRRTGKGDSRNSSNGVERPTWSNVTLPAGGSSRRLGEGARNCEWTSRASFRDPPRPLRVRPSRTREGDSRCTWNKACKPHGLQRGEGTAPRERGRIVESFTWLALLFLGETSTILGRDKHKGGWNDAS